MTLHQAPWGKTLFWASITITIMALASVAVLPFLPDAVPSWTLLLLPIIVAGCAPFVIRGYEITDDAIFIRRLFWKTRLDLAGLLSAEALPSAMRGSLRTCGNGGVYSFTGWYWNKLLGSYRAYVTDLNRTVVLRYKNRTIVISPTDPEEFVNQLNSHGGAR